jgi:DNA-binding MarR family transcriptional regulator
VRTQAFTSSGALFGEPAWDILLNLYIAHCEDRPVSRVKASTPAGISQSTGLRMLTDLEEKGLIVRTDDLNDRRRSFITLSEAAIAAIETSLRAFFVDPDV